MIDTDLAALYETETKKLKQQVKRNIERFPHDFMPACRTGRFELTKEEKQQLVTNCDRLSSHKHSSINPMVFTEQGAAMLSAVLRSEKAIKINIDIMRAFVYYRQLIINNTQIHQKLQHLDKKIEHVFSFLMDKLQAKKLNEDRQRIGFPYPNQS